jgi:hypothetical protein
MTTESGTIVSLELGTTPRRRHRGHRRYHRLILAARILLVAAAVVGLPAISVFAYKAVITAQCSKETTTDEFGHEYHAEEPSPGCTEPLLDLEEDMRLDAGIALMAAVFVLSSVMCYRRARRYKPRAPIRPVRQN